MMAYNNTSIIRPGFLITSEWLEKERACPHQQSRFKNVYPKGMRITTRNLNIARSKYRLNTRWLIETIRDYVELTKMRKYSGINPCKVQWTKEDSRLLHSAFVKVLKERDNGYE